MDKLLYKYQEYRTGAELEASPSNQAAQGILERMKSAIMGPETPSIMSPTGDLGKMPAAPQEPTTIRASTPQEAQKAKAAPTPQEAYDPSQAGLVESSVQAGKSQGAQALANTYTGAADFYGTLDSLAGIVSRKAGMGKPEMFAKLKGASEYWAEHYQGKVSIDDYMTRVVGGVLGSGPALVEFSMGPSWAALKGYAQDENLGTALYSAARRAGAGAVFKAAHTLDAPARIAAGTAYMTGESAADQIGQTGSLDLGKTAEAAGVGLGMMASGGFGPGNKAGLRQRVNPETWFETSPQGREIYKALDEGRIDPLTKDLAKQFYTTDLVRGGTALNDTSMAVVDKVNLLRKGVDDWILADQGITPDPAKDYAITGKTTTTRAADAETYQTAIELYQGAKADTLVEEWMHREYDRLPASERRAVTRAYEAHKAGLAEGAPVMSEAEFYAKGATDKFFADQVAAQKAANRPAWTKAVDAGRARWDGFVQAVRGVPGAKEDGSAPAMQPGAMSESYQAKDHPAMAGVDINNAAQVAEAQKLWAEKGVESPYFKKWFSDSKVVDAQGKPLVVYHGTKAGDKIRVFKPGDPKNGVYFTDSQEVAKSYSGAGKNAHIYETYLTFKEPLVVDAEGGNWGDLRNAKTGGWTIEKLFGYHNAFTDKLAAAVRKSGFDSIIIHNIQDVGPHGKKNMKPSTVYIALDPTQIKSATGNRGTFDANDPRISYQVRPVDDIIYDPTPAPPLDQKYAEGGNTNLQRINSTEDVLKLINDVSRHNRETGAFEAQTRGVRSQEETAKAAEGAVSIDQMLMRKEGQTGNAEQLYAARQLQAEFAGQLAGLVEKATATGDPADKDAAAKAWGVFAAVTAARDGMVAEAGRALNIMNRPVGDTKTQLVSAAFADLARKHGGERNADAIMDTLYDMARLSADGKLDIEELSRMARRLEKASTFDMILEARYMAMLANPATHIKNTIGNSIALGAQIPERFVAETIGRARGLFGGADLDRIEAGETAAMLYGGIEGMRAGVTAFLRTVRTGESTDPMGKLETSQRAISAENMGVDPASPWGKGIDFIAERLRTGNMLMGAEDDFFKAIGYSMELNARAHRTATREGLTGQEFADRIQELVTNPPWSMQMDAMDFAHYSTFTNALGEGMTHVQAALGTDRTVTLPSGKTIEVPTGKVFRLAVPFFRTPANIVAFGVKRSPLAVFAPSVWQDFANGGAARDMAVARITLGSTLGYMAAQAASAGLITGGGPSDPAEKENLRATGWQPYSVKVGNKWMSYQALEPYSAIIGAAADMALFDTYLEENERNNAAMMIASAFSQAVTSKTFMQGLDGMLNVLSDPDRYGDRYAQQFVASWVPSPVKAVRRDVDPLVREVWTVSDALQNSLPWSSGNLYPRRDRYGEPVTLGDVWLSNLVDPVRKSEVKNEGNSPTYAIDKAILDNHVPIQKPGKVLHWEGAKAELTPEEFDRYQTLPRDLGLVDALNRIVESQAFKDATGGPDGVKSHMIREVFGDFREQARYELVKESQGMPGGVAERLELDRINRQMKGESQ